MCVCSVRLFMGRTVRIAMSISWWTWRTIFDLAGFLGDLRDLLGTEIDVVESRSIHSYIRDRVLAEAVGL